MSETFERLSEAKKDRILNAAMAVFAEVGFAQASTNAIVKRAEISKGLLFHYFGSKEKLFAYVLTHCLTLLQREMPSLESFRGQDMLESIRAQALRKLQLAQDYPALFAFYHKALREEDPALQALVQAQQRRFTQPVYAALYTLFDDTAFRPGLDREKTYTVILSTLEKVGLDAFQHSDSSMAEIVARINDYVDYFKVLFYREAAR
ncbi:MAG: TetR/AcrR family transcriptional regulator [Candidatus Sericytochromatia bacterium]